MFCLLIGLMVVLFLPAFLPAGALKSVLSALDISGMLALILVIYYIVNLRNSDVVKFSELTEDINWNLILMFATVAPLAAAVSNSDAGILEYIQTVLNSVLGDMNPYVFTIFIILIGSIITQFCNNVAIVLMILPLMLTFATQLGANPMILTTLAAFNLNIAYCTPAASGPAAMIFSNKEWIGTKDSYIHGFVIFFINMLVTVIGMMLCTLLF